MDARWIVTSIHYDQDGESDCSDNSSREKDTDSIAMCWDNSLNKFWYTKYFVLVLIVQ